MIKLDFMEDSTSNVVKAPVNLNSTGIAWESDKNYKFKNPIIPEGQTLEQCKVVYYKHSIYFLNKSLLTLFFSSPCICM